METKKIVTHLRPYQTTARYALNTLINARRHPVFVSPTGTGKTETAVQTIADRISLGYRSFVLTPAYEIFNQWLSAFSRAGISAGTITDKGVRGRGRSVYVCMPLSLVNLLPYLPEKFAPDEIWTDEAHHSQASSWQAIYNHYENASRIGLTATPYRMDNKPLGDYYTDIVQTITMKEAIAGGYLAEPLIIAPREYAERIKIPDTDSAEISAEEQAEILGRAQIIGDVIGQYSETFAGLPVIVACCTHRHAEETTEQFRAAGWQWAHIHSGLSQYEREKIIKDIKSRKLNGVCTVGIGIEGMDIPGLYGLIWLRRTLSLTVYLQFTGRVLRPLQGKKYGIIIDAVGNTFLHGRPEMDRAWSLTTDYIPPIEGMAPTMKICPVCGVMNNVGNECCHICGCNIAEERAAIGADGGRGYPAVVDGELVILDGKQREERRVEVESVVRAGQAERERQEREQARRAETIPLSRQQKINILKHGLTGKRGTLFEGVKEYI